MAQHGIAWHGMAISRVLRFPEGSGYRVSCMTLASAWNGIKWAKNHYDVGRVPMISKTDMGVDLSGSRQTTKQY